MTKKNLIKPTLERLKHEYQSNRDRFRNLEHFCKESGYDFLYVKTMTTQHELDAEYDNTFSVIAERAKEQTVKKISDSETDLNVDHYETAKGILAIVRKKMTFPDGKLNYDISTPELGRLTDITAKVQQIQRLAAGLPGTIGKQDITVAPVNRAELEMKSDAELRKMLEGMKE